METQRASSIRGVCLAPPRCRRKTDIWLPNPYYLTTKPVELRNPSRSAPRGSRHQNARRQWKKPSLGHVRCSTTHISITAFMQGFRFLMIVVASAVAQCAPKSQCVQVVATETAPGHLLGRFFFSLIFLRAATLSCCSDRSLLVS